VLSRKLPYHQYTEGSNVRNAISRGELPKRPDPEDNDIDEIDDQSWELIISCCKPNPVDRLAIPKIQEILANMQIQDDRPEAGIMPGANILNLRLRPDVDWDQVEQLLGQIQVR
jgi:hypothetical protein